MRSNRKTSFAAVVALVVAACAPQAPGPLPAEELEKVKGLTQAFVQAFNAGDVNGLVATYADNAVVLPPGAELMRGADGIRQFFETGMAGPRGTLTVNTVETYGEGGLAYEVGTYSYSVTDAAGMTQTENGKYMVVLRKQADGSWKAVADTWNQDAPMMMPAAAPAPAEKK
ncbi:MAG: SgcJ/EcaC family oxidoreductase [Gemmatimonadetes bacterium]|nr:SgcJ/EcaC family oxidoreductase [Gemmatimonadota bacterium]